MSNTPSDATLSQLPSPAWSRRSSVQHGNVGAGQLSRRADWTVILRNPDQGQAVVYSPLSNRVTVRSLSPQELPLPSETSPPGYCTMCHRAFDTTNNNNSNYNHANGNGSRRSNPVQMDRNYFRLLARAISSAPGNNDYSQRSIPDLGAPVDNEPLHERAFNQGYYERFFVEEKQLGRGLRGQVFLCQHVLDQVTLGEYAIKKVPVGDNQNWLARMLREVHLLERLHHPNIIDYKHAWLEQCQLSSFGPAVPCLFILMECANGGNLDEYMAVDETDMTASQRARRRRSQPYPLAEPSSPRRLLALPEIEHFMLDTCEGLSHLHRLGIIHRDLKPSNLLLSYDEEQTTPVDGSGNDTGAAATTGQRAFRNWPRVLLSDFGECEDLTQLKRQQRRGTADRQRSGATGTLEFMAPELIAVDEQGHYLPNFSPKADMWSLGLLFYYLCYSQLPYRNIDDVDELKQEILQFDSIPQFPDYLRQEAGMAPIPAAFKDLIIALLSRNPMHRPSVDSILDYWKAGDYDCADFFGQPTTRSNSFRPGIFEATSSYAPSERGEDDTVDAADGASMSLLPVHMLSRMSRAITMDSQDSEGGTGEKRAGIATHHTPARSHARKLSLPNVITGADLYSRLDSQPTPIREVDTPILDTSDSLPDTSASRSPPINAERPFNQPPTRHQLIVRWIDRYNEHQSVTSALGMAAGLFKIWLCMWPCHPYRLPPPVLFYATLLLAFYEASGRLSLYRLGYLTLYYLVLHAAIWTVLPLHCPV